MAIDGILNIHKPSGWTSFDIVAFVRRRSGVRRVGHAGTLDPAATGVLPVCLGRATRVIEYMMNAHKTYRCKVLLGTETDTYDLEGAVLSTADTSGLAISRIRGALDRFQGEFPQTPPVFSALKQKGTPLYKLARAGREMTPPAPRSVTIYSLELTAIDLPRISLEVECGKGTYIRSLAHDLGRELGVGACLESLVRTRVGPFRIEASLTIEALERDFGEGLWQEKLLSPDEVLLDWPAAIVAEENATRILTGRAPRWESQTASPGAPFTSIAADRTLGGPAGGPLLSQDSTGSSKVSDPADSLLNRAPSIVREHCRAYDLSGAFLALLRREAEGDWRPEKVFAEKVDPA